MAVKIRLARKGRKKLAYYHIVVADSRSPRDGRYIEKIGRYNPLTNPATIELDFDKALGWLQNGAIPTETCRAILSYKGVLLKKHLFEGVKKGAFDESEANRRFEEWMKQNESKIEAKKSGLEKLRDDEIARKLASEKKINEDRASRLAKKQEKLAALAEAENQPAPESETQPSPEGQPSPVEQAPKEEQPSPVEKSASEEQPEGDNAEDQKAAETSSEEKPQE